MDLKSFVTTVFILVLLLAVPGSSKEGQDSDIYEIDYRGPETHSHRPPHLGSGNDVPPNNLKKHPQFKKQATQNAIKKGRKRKE